MKAGEDLIIYTQIEGDKYVYNGSSVHKGPLPIKNVLLHYREQGELSFKSLKMSGENGNFQGEISAGLKNVEYYITASDAFNTSFAPKNAPENFYRVIINVNSGDDEI
jgi:hypothetical protein